MRTGLGTKIFTFLLLVGMISLLTFNYMTTRETLVWLLGNSQPILLFALALSLVDLAGMSRVLSGEKPNQTNKNLYGILTVVWIIAIFVDIALTYVWAKYMLDSTGGYGPLSKIGVNAQDWFPLAIALAEACIRIPLVLMIGELIDGMRHSARRGAVNMSNMGMPAPKPK